MRAVLLRDTRIISQDTCRIFPVQHVLGEKRATNGFPVEIPACVCGKPGNFCVLRRSVSAFCPGWVEGAFCMKGGNSVLSDEKKLRAERFVRQREEKPRQMPGRIFEKTVRWDRNIE